MNIFLQFYHFLSTFKVVCIDNGSNNCLLFRFCKTSKIAEKPSQLRLSLHVSGVNRFYYVKYRNKVWRVVAWHRERLFLYRAGEDL